jgi:hypothetical protein
MSSVLLYIHLEYWLSMVSCFCAFFGTSQNLDVVIFQDTLKATIPQVIQIIHNDTPNPPATGPQPVIQSMGFSHVQSAAINMLGGLADYCQ